VKAFRPRFDSCRLEKGFHHWGHDLGPDDTPFEVGLGFTVRFDKESNFIGKQALLEQQRVGCSRQLRLCEVVAEEALILHDELVYQGDEIVGHVTSGGRGFRADKILCWVMFYRWPGLSPRALQIDIAGERFTLEVLDKPPYRAASK
jgi:glycine cleavage system aminomethyltransferase T